MLVSEDKSLVFEGLLLRNLLKNLSMILRYIPIKQDNQLFLKHFYGGLENRRV